MYRNNKRPFIVSCLMLHNDDRWARIVLDDLRKYSSGCFINLNDATPEIFKIVEEYESEFPGFIIKKIITKNDGRWNQGKQRDATVRMLDDIRPDIVLFPDSDEKFSSNFLEQLDSFWQDDSKKSFWFRLLYLWGDTRHFRNDGAFKHIHHVRAMKWSNDLSFLPYAGYACPTNLYSLDKNTRFHSNSPMIHYGYLGEEDREKKKNRNISWFSNELVKEETDKNMLILEVPECIKT